MKFKIRTDTATLAVFDTACLEHRHGDPADWWADATEELIEINAGNVFFCRLGADGDYLVEVVPPGREPAEGGVAAHLRCKSGSFCVAAGEDVAGDSRCGEVLAVEPGTYRVTIGRGDGKLWVEVRRSEAPPQNFFASSPSIDEQEFRVPPASGQLASVDLISALGHGQSEADVLMIAAIVGGRRQEAVDEVRVVSESRGIEFILEQRRLEYIHLYDTCVATRTHAAFERYPWELPCGLQFGMARDEVESKLGPALLSRRSWAIHDEGEFGIRVGFCVNGKLAQVNLLARKSRILSRFVDPVSKE